MSAVKVPITYTVVSAAKSSEVWFGGLTVGKSFVAYVANYRCSLKFTVHAGAIPLKRTQVKHVVLVAFVEEIRVINVLKMIATKILIYHYCKKPKEKPSCYNSSSPGIVETV